VTGWILRKEILSPNLQARFCKLYPADFSVVIYLFLCSLLSRFVCVSFSSFVPPGFFQTGSGAFPAAPSARAFDATIHLKTAPEHCVQITLVAESIFGPLSQTHFSKSEFKNEISSSALLDIQITLLCVCGVD